MTGTPTMDKHATGTEPLSVLTRIVKSAAASAFAPSLVKSTWGAPETEKSSAMSSFGYFL